MVLMGLLYRCLKFFPIIGTIRGAFCKAFFLIIELPFVLSVLCKLLMSMFVHIQIVRLCMHVSYLSVWEGQRLKCRLSKAANLKSAHTFDQRSAG